MAPTASSAVISITAVIRDEHGIRYMNCGDWVESCTALVEHEDGRFEIITWTDPVRRVAPVPAWRRARRSEAARFRDETAAFCDRLPANPACPRCGRGSTNAHDPTSQNLPVSAADIEAAAKVVAPFAVRTPLLSFPVLDERAGTKVFLKPEMLQRTGSFKFRGAFNKLSSIPQANRGGGVVAFSSGNHAQGVAAAAKISTCRRPS